MKYKLKNRSVGQDNLPTYLVAYMKKKQQFTYGFEIEGLFTKKFLTELEKEINKPRNKYKITDYDYKLDGSVNCDEESLDGSDDETTELNLGVFNSLEDMLKVLKLFKDGKNYYRDDSCGLHIHIKPLSVEMKGKLASYGFIMKLQAWAKKNLCACVGKRLNSTGHSYCKPYSKSFNAMKGYFKTGEKYVSIRNHPSGTYEFRFFSTCKHREENVEKFFKFFLKEAEKLEFSQRKVFNIKNEGIKNRDYKLSLKGTNKVLDIKIPFYLPIGSIKTLTELKMKQDEKELERRQQEEYVRERARRLAELNPALTLGEEADLTAPNIHHNTELRALTEEIIREYNLGNN